MRNLKCSKKHLIDVIAATAIFRFNANSFLYFSTIFLKIFLEFSWNLCFFYNIFVCYADANLAILVYASSAELDDKMIFL